ncbi:thymidylate synthase [Gordonia phage Fribs8]|nr:thymidylate synthase [Gordonia phage Fribs8]
MRVFYVKSLADNNIPLAVLADGRTIARGRWQSTDTDLVTHELDNVLVMTSVPSLPSHWAHRVYGEDKTVQTELNRLWAESHFQERVSGQPMNPAPSYLDWPWHSDKFKEAHKAKWSNRHDRLAPFDHTYPERFWPKEVKLDNLDDMGLSQRMGIRFDYGDLNDVVALLQKDPWTRQAFLPVWFPEDTGSTEGQRVPCTIGYHFIRNGAHLDVKYIIRSCDVTRHFRNDAYMAGRLLQWVQGKVIDPGTLSPYVGTLTMFISNLHLFKDDVWRIEQ